MDRFNTSKLPAGLTKLIKAGRPFILEEDGQLIARVTPASAILTEREKERLKLVPHDVSECLGTCWRHREAEDAVSAEVA